MRFPFVDAWFHCFYFYSHFLSNLFLFFFFVEVNLQHSAIWMAGVYLMLLMQFLENKVAMELTRSEFVEAQEVGGISQYYNLMFLDSCI